MCVAVHTYIHIFPSPFFTRSFGCVREWCIDFSSYTLGYNFIGFLLSIGLAEAADGDMTLEQRIEQLRDDHQQTLVR